MKRKIFITGGHLTPALAMIDYLDPGEWDIWYIARRTALEDDPSISREYQILQKEYRSIKLLIISTGKINRFLSPKLLMSLIKIPLGFLQSLYWLIKYKPDIILSFGGYVALPVCVCAFLLGIPVITHEQTQTIGIANKVIGLVSRKICLSWTGTQKETNQKTVVTGLPIRKIIFKQLQKLAINTDKPLIYISGGSLGSHTINLLLMPILRKLLEEFSIVHQCGDTVKYNDLQKLSDFKNGLPDQLKNRYLPLSFVHQEYIGWLYRNCAFVIGRSGANTVYELASLGIPAIFLPLPWASLNEQHKNAAFFASHQAGIILEQQKLTSDELYRNILEFYRDLGSFKGKAGCLKNLIRLDAEQHLYSEIEKILNR